MKFNPKYLNKISEQILKSQTQAQALKKLGQKGDWRHQHQELLKKVEEETGFWGSKHTPHSEVRLKDLKKDELFLRKLTPLTNLQSEDQERLRLLVKKYNLF